MAIVAAILSGCASGDAEAARVDEVIAELEHVSESSTLVRRPGLPTNREFTTYVTFTDGATESEKAQALDGALVAARDILGPVANAGFILRVEGGALAIDMESAVETLGDVGTQRAADLEVGSLSLSTETLRAYESPGGES